MRLVIPAICFLFLLFACKGNDKAKTPLFIQIENSGIDFINKVVDTKTDNSFYFRNFYNGGGVALGDLNNDSLPDVVLTSNMGENRIYLNKGSFSFEDITPSSGFRQDSMWSTGVVMADINADGWLDVYICNSGHMKTGNRRNKLYINNRDLTFTEQSEKYGLDISGYCTQASFFDYDLDGDLDCFLINNSPMPFSSLNYATLRDVDVSKWKVDENMKGGGNHLYRNDGGKFTEVTAEAGLHTGLISFGLGVSVGDMNGDDYPDIYVGNDFIEKDYLYINQKNGSFKDELEDRLQKISMSSMSSDLGDINNDGHPEIFTTDMIPEDDFRLKTTGTFDNIDLYLSKQKAGLYHQYVMNCLQLNNGDGSFSEIGKFSGVSATDWSWGALFFDADNDGYNDIYVCNGIAKDLGDLDFLDFFSNDVYSRMLETGRRPEIEELLKHIPVQPLPNRVFRNTGNLRFDDVGEAWGFGEPGFSNSIAYADLDNDGDLDLVINNENAPASVFKNRAREQNGHHYLSISLGGDSLNPFAVGSKVKVHSKGNVFYRELHPARGFQSSMDYRLQIGLGNLTTIDSMIITWPDRSCTTLLHPVVDRHHYIQKSGKGQIRLKPFTASTLFSLVDSSLQRHREDDHVDFYFERNLPYLLSREGPQVARADVNDDGREDLYIGGASGQSGQLYLQQENGFRREEIPGHESFIAFEEIAVLFFDADRDGDMDLFIGSGGNHSRPGSRELQHRLYKNDGKGGFVLDIRAFPNNDMNISVAVAHDYDGDGDQDLFVGGRSVPFSFGSTPRSYLYNNDGNARFTDVTPPALAHIGMVTAAVWANIAGNEKKELVVTGEWMPTMIFEYNNGTFSLIKNTPFADLHGLWQSIAAGDLNSDGHTDLVIGNTGENFYLQPGQDSPVKLWLSDFDGSGTKESFLTRRTGGKDMPVFLKRDVTEQFPGLKKANLKHRDYAGKSIEDLFGKEKLKNAEVKYFQYVSSIIAFNDGNGNFTIEPLPARVQLSSVNAICIEDLNADGSPDLVMGGNCFGFPPQFGRLDASFGHVLFNNGKGGFEWIPPVRSGIFERTEVRDIESLRVGERKMLLFTRNNGLPVIYELKNMASQ
jgi:hypothetical protein